jgi:hypothetical protein
MVFERHQKSRAFFRFLPVLLVFFFCVQGRAVAQKEPADPKNPMVHALRDRAIVLHMVTSVLENKDTVVWNSDSYKVTIPGRPVGLKVVGENIAVSVQFTAYPRRNGRGVLVAQGRVWIDVPEQGMQYKTVMQTVPLKYGEQVFFFPLGSGEEPDNARIRIQIEMTRYTETPVNED